MLVKKWCREEEDDEEEVSGYWMTLRKRENTVNWKGKLHVWLSGKLALEEALNLLWDRLRDDVDDSGHENRKTCGKVILYYYP